MTNWEARWDNGTSGVPTSILESLLAWRIPVGKGNKYFDAVERHSYSPEAKGPIFRVGRKKIASWGQVGALADLPPGLSSKVAPGVPFRLQLGTRLLVGILLVGRADQALN